MEERNRRREPEILRFVRKIKVNWESGCWEWTGATDPAGYSRFTWWNEGKQRWVSGYAHRWSRLHFLGEYPDNTETDHLCKVRHCVSPDPDHTEATTHKVNVRRSNNRAAQNARKTACPKGHEYSESNTYIQKGGGRSCRACNRNRYNKRMPGGVGNKVVHHLER